MTIGVEVIDVEQYCYLRKPITNDKDIQIPNTNRRIRLTWIEFGKLNHLLQITTKNL